MLLPAWELYTHMVCLAEALVHLRKRKKADVLRQYDDIVANHTLELLKSKSLSVMGFQNKVFC
jgi:hypothetical protein